MKKTAKNAMAAEKTAKRDADALAHIDVMEDPVKLRALMANAVRLNVPEVHQAAFRRLAFVRSEGEPGSVEHDMWTAIAAIEELKRIDAGKTVRLGFLRRNIEKIGMVPAMDKLASKPEATDRFSDLIAGHYPDLTVEAVVMRHSADFSAEACAQSSDRLTQAGLNPSTLVPV